MVSYSDAEHFYTYRVYPNFHQSSTMLQWLKTSPWVYNQYPWTVGK
ncbi:helix-turn-helix domain-containing protein [Umezakia ovalisporum]